ncbi:MAG: adenylate/guanylate cyclase protein [Nocardioidaceae bacterium]|nr:adenylate/guanylate cyclase protein [Nocardioidaceae bacterium]
MNRSEIRDELERALLGTDPKYTSAEVAEFAGIKLEDAKKHWRALGFADTGDDTAYGEPDIGALKTVSAAIESGLLDEETVSKLTRALGHTMSRLADWQVATLVERLESQVQDGASDSRLMGALELAKTVTPAFDELILYAWRRHLTASVMRMEGLGAADEELLSGEVTVGFADLVRFTALSNGLDDHSLGNLVESFETQCMDTITATDSRAIKTLGDAVLFVAPTPSAGVETALRIVERIGGDPHLPDVRVGLATGSLVNRLGDVFGPPVNLASRLTGVARRNRVIIDQVTAAALGDEFETRPLPARPLHGFGMVEPVTVRRVWTYNG